jgi:hypothetical protein
MPRLRSLLASSLFLLAIGTPCTGNAVGPEIRTGAPDAPSVGRAEPNNRVLLAQTKLPSLREINLLAADQGGQPMVVPNDDWFKPISGKEGDGASVSAGQEAVYAFKDEKPAKFSKFSVLITGESGTNPKQIELLVANDSPTGTFRSVSTLNIYNAKLVKSPYQEVSFSETTAKYVKIRMLATYNCCGGIWLGQVRLLGTLAE